MEGSWNYTASCPFFITVTGRIRLAPVSGGQFYGPIADSLGQSGLVTVTLVGRALQGRNDWTLGVVETWTGTPNLGGQSFSARSSSGCTPTVRRG